MNPDDKIQSKSLESTDEMDFYDKIADKPLIPDGTPENIDIEKTGNPYPNYNFGDIIQFKPDRTVTEDKPRAKTEKETEIEKITDLAYKVHINYSKFQSKLSDYLDHHLGNRKMELVNSSYYKIHTDLVTPALFQKLKDIECTFYITSEEYTYCGENLNICIHIAWDYTEGV